MLFNCLTMNSIVCFCKKIKCALRAKFATHAWYAHVVFFVCCLFDKSVHFVGGSWASCARCVCVRQAKYFVVCSAPLVIGRRTTFLSLVTFLNRTYMFKSVFSFCFCSIFNFCGYCRCGRFLFQSPQTHQRMHDTLVMLMRKKSVKHVNSHTAAMIDNAFYTCSPPEAPPRRERARLLPWQVCDCCDCCGACVVYAY